MDNTGKDGHTRNLHETAGINQEMQKVTKTVEEIESSITYATYIASLHECEKQVVFWRTLTITILSFLIFGILSMGLSLILL